MDAFSPRFFLASSLWKRIFNERLSLITFYCYNFYLHWDGLSEIAQIGDERGGNEAEEGAQCACKNGSHWSNQGTKHQNAVSSIEAWSKMCRPFNVYCTSTTLRRHTCCASIRVCGDVDLDKVTTKPSQPDSKEEEYIMPARGHSKRCRLFR